MIGIFLIYSTNEALKRACPFKLDNNFSFRMYNKLDVTVQNELRNILISQMPNFETGTDFNPLNSPENIIAIDTDYDKIQPHDWIELFSTLVSDSYIFLSAAGAKSYSMVTCNTKTYRVNAFPEAVAIRAGITQNKNIAKIEYSEIQVLKSTDLKTLEPILKSTARQYTSCLKFGYDSTIFTTLMFSIIEGMLTHKPKNHCTITITHQIKNKFFYLNQSIFNKKINSPFTGCSDEKLFAKLYELRSKIVHGEIYSTDEFEPYKFTDKQECLVDIVTVNYFLESIFRELFICWIKKPEDMKLLRNC